MPPSLGSSSQASPQEKKGASSVARGARSGGSGGGSFLRHFCLCGVSSARDGDSHGGDRDHNNDAAAAKSRAHNHVTGGGGGGGGGGREVAARRRSSAFESTSVSTSRSPPHSPPAESKTNNKADAGMSWSSDGLHREVQEVAQREPDLRQLKREDIEDWLKESEKNSRNQSRSSLHNSDNDNTSSKTSEGKSSLDEANLTKVMDMCTRNVVRPNDANNGMFDGALRCSSAARTGEQGDDVGTVEQDERVVSTLSLSMKEKQLKPRYEEMTDKHVTQNGFTNSAHDESTGEYTGLREKPSDDPARLDVLRSLNLLDQNNREARFNAYTSLAQRIFNTDMCFISLVDENRQWFLSNQGLPGVDETARNISFCGWTLLSREPTTLVVRDATKDPRFKNNPLVTDSPHIRSYCGTPIVIDSAGVPGMTGSFRIGTLCIIDRTPRNISDEHRRVLEIIAEMVAEEVGSCVRDRKLRKELENALERAQDGSKAKERFVATMSHELRTPLNAVVNASELLQQHMHSRTKSGESSRRLLKRRKAPSSSEGNDEDDAAETQDDKCEEEELLAVLQTASMQMIDLINNVLDFSKFNEKSTTIEPSPMNVRDAAQQAVKIAEMAAIGRHDFNTEFHMSEDVPACVLLDGHIIRQVLTNLCANAVKFTPNGGNVRLSVNIAPPSWREIMQVEGQPPPVTHGMSMEEIRLIKQYTNVQPLELMFTVSDSGIGVEREKRQDIFKVFTQADDNVNRVFGGSGLGLAICSKLVEFMHGGIWVTSSGKDKGSQFKFVVRAYTADGLFCPRPEDYSAVSEASSSRSLLVNADAVTTDDVANLDVKEIGSEATDAEIFESMRVMVVDDNATNRLVMKKQLRGLKMDQDHVTFADSGVVALENLVNSEAEATMPDVVLMDLHMPVMDGYTATAAIKGGAKGVQKYLHMASPENSEEMITKYGSLAENAKTATSKKTPAIIAFTADCSADSDKILNQLGITHKLVKPVRRDELMITLANVMRRRKA